MTIHVSKLNMHLCLDGFTTDAIVFTWKNGEPVQVTKILLLSEFALVSYTTDYCTTRTNTGKCWIGDFLCALTGHCHQVNTVAWKRTSCSRGRRPNTCASGSFRPQSSHSYRSPLSVWSRSRLVCAYWWPFWSCSTFMCSTSATRPRPTPPTPMPRTVGCPHALFSWPQPLLNWP